MKDIIIISNYWHFKNEKISSRYSAIAEMLFNKGFNTEVVTSSFYHTKKQQRCPEETIANYNYTLLREKSYKKNISFSRIISHELFSHEVLKYLKTREKPDLVYLFMPPIGLASRLTDYCKKHDIKLVIDVLDLWPEAFYMVLPKFIGLPLLLPMKRSAEYIYKKADAVVSVSKNYADKINRFRKTNDTCPVYIGIDYALFNAALSTSCEKPERERRFMLGYVGTLGKSYDLHTLMDAMKINCESGFDVVQLIIMGDGPMKADFEEYARKLKLPVTFLGRLPYERMVGILCQCDFTINILDANSSASIINKHADYTAAGLPTINVQSDNEFNNLLDEYQCGFHCEPGNACKLSEIIKQMCNDNCNRTQMGKNIKLLAQREFDRNYTYVQIIEHINDTLKQ